MTIQIATKTDLTLASRLAISNATLNEKSAPPAIHRRELGDLARVAFMRGKWFARITGNGATGAGTLRMMAGTDVLASVAVDFAANADQSEALAIEVSGLSGTKTLYVEYECTTTGDAGVVDAWAELEHPLIVAA